MYLGGVGDLSVKERGQLAREDLGVLKKLADKLPEFLSAPSRFSSCSS